ncbi:MAG: serine hydrolase [Flavobacteriaceae bacterium]|nr:serine hydrolase [Flavobacteriaceae bacterium]
MKKFTSIIAIFFICTISFGQIDFSESNKIEHSILSEMDIKISNGDYEQITSVLVVKDGRLIYEKYYNGADKDTKHNVRSGTKTIATFLTGLAIDKGFIKSEKDKIFKYLQHKMPIKNPDPRKNNITIEDLLTMSCMLETDDNNYMSRGHEERMYFIEDWTQFFVDLPIRSYPFNPPPSEQPYGRFFHYSSAQAAAVSEIVESAIGSPADAFLKEYLFNPLAINDYKLHYTPSKIINTAGGSEYRSRDFLKMIQLCLQNGQWNGEQIISKNYMQKATTAKASAREGVEYGYFLWINPFGKDKKYDAYYMSGNGGNKMVAIPELNATVVITTTNYNNRNAHGYSNELLNQYIVPVLSGN